MTSYAECLDIFGSVRVDMVQRNDGVFVCTMGDADDSKAYQAWAKAGNTLDPPYQSVDLVSYTLTKSWQVEVGGIVVAGVKVLTDDRSKTLIMGMRMGADKDPTITDDFYAADGTTHTIDASAIIAISDAVSAHVRACFSMRSTVLSGIKAGTIKTTGDVDKAAWPSNT